MTKEKRVSETRPVEAEEKGSYHIFDLLNQVNFEAVGIHEYTRLEKTSLE